MPKGVASLLKHGVVETKLNAVNMTAWMHKEFDIMDQDALCGLQGAWEASNKRMNVFCACQTQRGAQPQLVHCAC
jgi:hypothetical protein